MVLATSSYPCCLFHSCSRCSLYPGGGSGEPSQPCLLGMWDPAGAGPLATGALSPRTSDWLPQLQHNPVPALGLLCAQGTSQFCSGSLGRCLLKIRPWLEPAAHWFPHPEFAVLWQKFPSHNHCFPCHGCHVRNYQTSEGKKKKTTDGKLDAASNCKVSLGVFWLEPGEFPLFP